MPKIGGFPLTLIVALTTVLRTTVLHCDVKITDCINNDVKVVSALCDSGAQISVLRADVAGNLELLSVGKVKLRGIVGNPVSADLVKLSVSLAETESINGYIEIMCCMC